MLRFRVYIAPTMHEIAYPQGQAIEQHGAVPAGMTAQGAGNVQGLLHRQPMIAPAFPVQTNLLGHLVVECLRRREIYGPRSSVHQPLGERALTRTNAAEHEGQGR